MTICYECPKCMSVDAFNPDRVNKFPGDCPLEDQE